MLLDEVRDAESVVFTYRKDLKEMGMRLKQQHNLYQVCIPFVQVLSVVHLNRVLIQNNMNLKTDQDEKGLNLN